MSKNKPERKPVTRGRKRSWQRPRVKSGRLFESNSLACGKNFDDGPGGQCNQSPELS